MPEKKSRARLSPEEWKEFVAVYMKAFETRPRNAAYTAAVREMRMQGKPYPSWRSLLRRLRGEQQEESGNPAEPSGQSDSFEKTDLPKKDDSALALDLLRCYRFRREGDLDALTDRLFPHLGDSDSDGKGAEQ